MNIELKKQRNDLLKRTNILAKITDVKTPSRKEVLSKVAAMLGIDDNLIVIDNIEQNFGEHISLAYIKVYDDINTLKELESKFKLKRTGVEETSKDAPKEDAPKKEAPSEEPKEEAPKKEDPSEEPKEDAPKKEAPSEEPKEDAPKKEAPSEEPK